MNPQRQEGNREKASRKPKWKNYDFTMILSRITTSHGIAVKWFLKVYWLLPFSIVASFKKHRRLFWKASWILGPVHQLHFPKVSFPYFSRFFFSSSTEIVDSLTEVILESTDTWHKTLLIFVWQNGHIGHSELGCFVGPCQNIGLCCWITASTRRSLFLDWHPARKKQ